MKFTSKRLISMMLVLAFALAMLPVAVFAADTTTLYCAAPSNWGNCNVYWWGSSQSNPGWPGEAMTKGEDGIWYYEVPSDADNVIFNNGSGTQTADLVMPTDDKVQWNYDAKEWVVYGTEVEEVETVYYLRGTMNTWGLSNPMTKVDDSTYTITMDLAAGTYEYKAAVEDWSWSCPGGSNMSLTLEADDSVTFTLDLTANSLTYTLGSGTVVETVYYLRGTMNNWGTSDAFVKQDDGTYAITLSLEAGTYEYKAAVEDWSWTVPGGDNAVLTLTEAADITFVLDLTAGTVTTNAPAVSTAPEALVLGSNNFELIEGDTNVLSSTYTVTEDGALSITPSAMSAYDAYAGEWSEVPAEYIPMQFGRMYALMVNGEQVWLPCEINVSAGDVIEIGFKSYMGTATKLTIDLAMVEPTPKYYVAGSEGLCGVEWDPGYADNMMYETGTGYYELNLGVYEAGTYEFKVTTGSWDTPSYGDANGNNMSVTVKSVASWVRICFNAETCEITYIVEEWGAGELKFQLNADASANSESVDLRLITSVDSLDYASVKFYITINGETAEVACDTVYTAINANGSTLTCEDIFFYEGYLVTYTIEDIPAEYFGADIQVYAGYQPLDAEVDPWSTNGRTVVLSDILG